MSDVQPPNPQQPPPYQAYPPPFQPQPPNFPQSGYPAQQRYPAPGYGYPAPSSVEVLPPAAPQVPAEAWQPRTYPQLLRGPRHRWWRPLVSIAVVLGCFAALLVVATVAFFVTALATGLDLETLANDLAVMARPEFVLLNNLLLAALIPVAMVGVWVGHLWRPRWVSSVRPGMRWRLLAECTVISLVLFVVGSVVFFVLDGLPEGRGQHVAVLLAIILLTTPFQAAGEEWFFRGWMTQTIGSWFASPLAAALVAGAVSSLLFAAAHGSQNIWLFADRLAFGVLASYLTWRTGGLEASTAAHAINNIVVFVPVILTGGLEESILITEAPADLVVLDIVMLVLLGALLTWWARRRGVQRFHDPQQQPLPPAPARFGPYPAPGVASPTGSTTGSPPW